MTIRVIAAVAVLLAASSGAAEAQWTDLINQCTTGSVRTCASFQARVSDAGGGRTRLEIRVRNLWGVLEDGSLTGSILAQLGVASPDLVNVENDSPIAQAVEGATATGDPGSMWDFHRSTARLGDVEWALAAGSGGSSNGNGGIYGCLATSPRSDYFTTCVDGAEGGWVQFSLTTEGTVDIDQLQLAWGVMAVGPQDLSLQGTTCVAGDCDQTVVPEPLSMVLMATGLLGIGGAARIRGRRRHRREIGSESEPM